MRCRRGVIAKIRRLHPCISVRLPSLLAYISLSSCHRVSIGFASSFVQGVTGRLQRIGLMLLRPTSLPRKGPPPLSEMFNPPASNRRWRTRFPNYEYLSLNPTPPVYLASPPLPARATSREDHIYSTSTLRNPGCQRGNKTRLTRIARGVWKVHQAGFTNISASLS